MKRLFYNNTIQNADEAVLAIAENLIDSVLISSVVTKPFSPAISHEYIVTATFTVNSSTVNLTSTSGVELKENELEHCQITNLSGLEFSKIKSNTGDTLILFEKSTVSYTNVLTRITQKTKAPYFCDRVYYNNAYSSIIDDKIQKAVEAQYNYLIENQGVENEQNLQSESISSNYSYTIGDSNNARNKIICPLAIELLDYLYNF